jgi:hypothetical protein
VTYQAESQRLLSLRSDRLKSRIAKAGVARPIDTSVVAVGGGSAPVTSTSTQAIASIDSVKTVATESSGVPVLPRSNTDVDHLSIQHSGVLSRSWQKVKITTLDKDGNVVTSPGFGGKVYVIPEFGDANIRPNELTSLDFTNGVAIVNVMAKSNKTLFIATRGAFTSLSAPMTFER